MLFLLGKSTEIWRAAELKWMVKERSRVKVVCRAYLKNREDVFVESKTNLIPLLGQNKHITLANTLSGDLAFLSPTGPPIYMYDQTEATSRNKCLFFRVHSIFLQCGSQNNSVWWVDIKGRELS